MRIWSISLIKSELKWCKHPSRSLFLYSCRYWNSRYVHIQFYFQLFKWYYCIINTKNFLWYFMCLNVNLLLLLFRPAEAPSYIVPKPATHTKLVQFETRPGVYQDRYSFECQFEPSADNDILYQVYWFMNGESVWTSKAVGKDSLRDTDLKEEDGRLNDRLNFEVYNLSALCSCIIIEKMTEIYLTYIFSLQNWRNNHQVSIFLNLWCNRRTIHLMLIIEHFLNFDLLYLHDEKLLYFRENTIHFYSPYHIVQITDFLNFSMNTARINLKLAQKF